MVSELRKLRPHGAVLAWFDTVEASNVFISAVTLGEIHAGIELTRRQDQAKADEIEEWADQVSASYNVLPMDGASFRQWARFMHRKSNALPEDAMIAATAHLHRLTVVTRNVVDFKAFRVPLLNPFAPGKE